MQASRTPYNTGKVKIGLAYEPSRKTPLTHEERQVQDALLGLFDNKEERAAKRYVGVVLIVCLIALVVAHAPR
jgi:hypothetical protein